MLPIRKVTFLQKVYLGDNPNLKKYFSELMKKQLQHLPHIQSHIQSGKKIESMFVNTNSDSSSIEGGKCGEKYININLVSEITSIDFDEGIEIYEDFDDEKYQKFLSEEFNAYENMHNGTVVNTEENNEKIALEWAKTSQGDAFKEKNFKKAEYRPKFFKVKFATNYSQNSSDLELVIDEPSLNEILR